MSVNEWINAFTATTNKCSRLPVSRSYFFPQNTQQTTKIRLRASASSFTGHPKAKIRSRTNEGRVGVSSAMSRVATTNSLHVFQVREWTTCVVGGLVNACDALRTCNGDFGGSRRLPLACSPRRVGNAHSLRPGVAGGASERRPSTTVSGVWRSTGRCIYFIRSGLRRTG